MYISIAIETLQLNSIIDFSLYLKRNGDAVLYREQDLPFGEEEKGRLIENNVKEVFILSIDKKKYLRYVEKNLDSIIGDETYPVDKKAGLVYDSAKSIIFDVLEHPRSGENIKRSGKVISNTLDYILSDELSFRQLVKVTSYDYYTYTHSVNVGVFAIALANKLDIYNRDQIFTLGWGAILHDIGKTKVLKMSGSK